MEINLKVQISENEHVEICKSIYNKKNKFIKWGFTLIGSFILLMAILGMLGDFYQNNLGDRYSAYLVNALIGAFFIWGVSFLRQYQNRKTYRANRTAYEDIIYKINDEYIDSKTKVSESRITWNAVHEIINTPNWILIMPNSVSCYSLPKKALTNEEIKWVISKKSV